MEASSKFLAVLTGLLVSVCALAQGQINTRHEKIKDFPTKITKVVIPDDDFLSEALREGVTSSWTVTPYEFCTLDEFEKVKTSENFYFLLTVNNKTKNEEVPGIKMLSLVKGGADAAKGINEMLELASFPLCSATGSSGRELVMIPAILRVIQDHAMTQMNSELKAYSKIKVLAKDMRRLAKKQVYISREDLASQVSESDIRNLNDDFIIGDEDMVDSILIERTYNAVVGYYVAPEDPVEGAYCYKMLFTADTNKLLYYRKHRISAGRGKGFLRKDLHLINHAMR